MAEFINEELWDKITSELHGLNARSIMDPIFAFGHAIDWTVLLAFHLLLFVFVIKTRKNSGVQMAVFLLSMLGIFFAERLNIFLGRRWESFARQPYFDRRGVFISVLWSGPLLFIDTAILVNTLLTLVSLMVQWKRAELRYRARRGHPPMNGKLE